LSCLTKPTRRKVVWAISIGVNYYAAESCHGKSVRDATDMGKLLEKGTTAMKPDTLTAASPIVKSNPPRPSKKPDHWPTIASFKAKMDEAIEFAEPRYFIYIHFSGCRQ
jgi:hypothetical protein